MSGVVETPMTMKDTIINSLTGKEQKVDNNTMNEDFENRREKTKKQEKDGASSKLLKPCLSPQLSLKEQVEKDNNDNSSLSFSLYTFFIYVYI